jgi:hypothetical protein
MMRFPEERELILQTDRPPQLETPLHYFRQSLLPIAECDASCACEQHVSGVSEGY